MGLLASSPSSHVSPKAPTPSPDGAYIAPDRNARQHCWDARDGFFACLERNSIVDSITEKEKTNEVCGTENEKLEGECAKSWVCYSHRLFPVIMDLDTVGFLSEIDC